MEETWAQVRGSMGSFRVRFEPGTDSRCVSSRCSGWLPISLAPNPRGTSINVSAQDLAAMSRFVMLVQVTGGEDRNALRDLVDERILPRLAAAPGASAR